MFCRGPQKYTAEKCAVTRGCASWCSVKFIRHIGHIDTACIGPWMPASFSQSEKVRDCWAKFS